MLLSLINLSHHRLMHNRITPEQQDTATIDSRSNACAGGSAVPQLYELIYVSLATREMSLPDLAALLTECRDNNRRYNITGLLVYHNREFMQLLEGRKEDVLNLYDLIVRDERHQQVHLMWEGAIAQRSFADWRMAFLMPGEMSLDDDPAYSRFLQEGLGGQSDGAAETVGKQFLLSLRNDFLKAARVI